MLTVVKRNFWTLPECAFRFKFSVSILVESKRQSTCHADQVFFQSHVHSVFHTVAANIICNPRIPGFSSLKAGQLLLGIQYPTSHSYLHPYLFQILVHTPQEKLFVRVFNLHGVSLEYPIPLSFDRGSTLTCASKLVFIFIFMFMFLLGNTHWILNLTHAQRNVQNDFTSVRIALYVQRQNNRECCRVPGVP